MTRLILNCLLLSYLYKTYRKNSQLPWELLSSFQSFIFFFSHTCIEQCALHNSWHDSNVFKLRSKYCLSVICLLSVSTVSTRFCKDYNEIKFKKTASWNTVMCKLWEMKELAGAGVGSKWIGVQYLFNNCIHASMQLSH